MKLHLEIPRLLRSVLPGALLAAVATAAAWAQPGGAPEGFQPYGQWKLQADGERVSDARFYRDGRTGAVLVLSEARDLRAILFPRNRQVHFLGPEALAEDAAGWYRILPGKRPHTSAEFQLSDGLPSFQHGASAIQFLRKPSLLGPQTREGLLENDPTYAARGRSYSPQSVHMSTLRSVEEPVHVKIFFGSWCSTCAEMLPKILAVEKALDHDPITFEYYGLPESYDDAEAKRLGVTSVPTGVLFRDGEEIGRVRPASWRFPELALVQALAGFTGPQ